MTNSRYLEDGLKSVFNSSMDGFVDIDDNLVPFSRNVAKAINSMYDGQLQQPIREQDFVWHNMDKLKAIRQIVGFKRNSLLLDMEAQGIIENIRPYPYSIEVLRALGHGRKLPLMTSRSLFYKDAIGMTTRWADHYLNQEGYARQEIIFNPNKLEEARRRDLKFAFEDHLPTIMELLGNGLYVFMHSMPHNRMGRYDYKKLDEEELEKKKVLIDELKNFENERLFTFISYKSIYSRLVNIRR